MEYTNISKLSILLTSFFVISSILTAVIVPLIISIGKKFKIYDIPNKRSQHSTPLVRIGGLAIYLGFSLTCLISIWLCKINSISMDDYYFIALLISFLIMMIGFIDDLNSLSPLLRLVFQFILSFFVWSSSIKIEALQNSFIAFLPEYIILPKLVSLLITLIWIAGVINAINWFDGLDGMAAGVAIIIGTVLLIISVYSNQLSNAILSSSLIGACLGYLKFNLNPSRIMMGDCGSYLIGFLLAFISLNATSNVITINNEYLKTINVLIPFLCLGLPILDMTRVILVRLTQGNSAFLPDREHIHHRLLDLGFNEKETLMIVCSSTLLLSSLALINLNIEIGNFLVMIGLCTLLFFAIKKLY
tara:strand:- start:10879 stop:11958 length:1080 start_codon:yes stop_codon:yes gene_type:complete